jgi:hypothetical protein
MLTYPGDCAASTWPYCHVDTQKFQASATHRRPLSTAHRSSEANGMIIPATRAGKIEVPSGVTSRSCQLRSGQPPAMMLSPSPAQVAEASPVI